MANPQNKAATGLLQKRLPSLHLCLALLLLFSATTIACADPIRLYLHDLPHRLSGDGDKHYNSVLQVIFKAAENGFQPVISPIKRTANAFSGDHRSCSFPTNVRAMRAARENPDLNWIASVPTDVVSVRIYTAPGHPDITGVESLVPDRTGLILGSAAGLLVKGNLEAFRHIQTEAQLIAMLQRGRLDAFLGHHPDTLLALEEQGGDGLLKTASYYPDSFRFPVSIVCHDFAEARALMPKIDEAILELHRSGRMRELLGRHAELPDADTLDIWENMAEGARDALY